MPSGIFKVKRYVAFSEGDYANRSENAHFRRLPLVAFSDQGRRAVLFIDGRRVEVKGLSAAWVECRLDALARLLNLDRRAVGSEY